MPFIIINPLPLPILKKFFFLLFFHNEDYGKLWTPKTIKPWDLRQYKSKSAYPNDAEHQIIHYIL